MKQSPFSWWVAVVFLLLSATFIFDIWSETGRQKIMHAPVDPAFFDTKPVRSPKLEANITKNGIKHTCQECHQQIEPTNIQKNFFSAHKDIELRHGENQSCRHCHSTDNKEMLVDINGAQIAFNKSQETCFKCHGLKYRDWQKGIHGKMDLYWDKNKRQDSQRPTCVSCHDPHNPAFALMQPSPAPYRYNYVDQKESLESTHTHE